MRDADSGRRQFSNARSPLRVSLAGGGTDLPSYYRESGGLVVGLAIDRYSAVSVFPRDFERGVRAAWPGGLEEVESSERLTNGFARSALERAHVSGDVSLASFADVPNGTGLGGSGAFTVALLAALNPSDATPVDLAEQAFAIETRELGRTVGKQDPYLSALGGLNALHIGHDGTVDVESIPLTTRVREFFTTHLMLFYTGRVHDAGLQLAAQEENFRSGARGTERALANIHRLAKQTTALLRDADVEHIGEILDEHWQNKRQISALVSDQRLDDLYAEARSNGASGGKILGAGGGGFFLLSARNEGDAVRLRRCMSSSGLRELHFSVDDIGVQVRSFDLAIRHESGMVRNGEC